MMKFPGFDIQGPADNIGPLRRKEFPGFDIQGPAKNIGP